MESLPELYMWVLAFLPALVLVASACLVVGFIRRGRLWGMALIVIGVLLLVLGGVSTYSLKGSGLFT